MHKYLGHRSTAYIDVLNLLWCDVFSLSQLEDVLLPVNNLQNSTLFTTTVRIKNWLEPGGKWTFAELTVVVLFSPQPS